MPLSSKQLRQFITSTDTKVSSDFNVFLHYSIQNCENEAAIALATNDLLSSSKTLVKGLEIVTSIVSYCSLSVLKENSVKWASHCISKHPGTDNNRELKLSTLACIVENVGTIEAFNKKFLSEYLSDTLKSCLHSGNKSAQISALKCLSACMKHFANWFGNHKQKVEPFILQFLDASGKEEVKYAALAFHYLQQTGGAGVEKINHKNNFSATFRKLCSTVHSLYDYFLDNVEIDRLDYLHDGPFTFKTLPSDFGAVKVLETTATRIINTVVFIKTMIAKGFPAIKQLSPKDVVDIVTRGLSLHICLDEPNLSLESSVHSLLLSQIQVELLSLFRGFLITYSACVIPFTYTLTKTFLNMLKRIEICNCFTTHSNYIQNTYKTLQRWLSSTRSAHQLHLQENLIPILLKNIYSEKKKVLLNLNVAYKNKGKSKTKAAANTTDLPSQKEETLYLIGPRLKEQKCEFSLDLLHIILETTHLKVDKSIVQELKNGVLQSLCDSQTYHTSAPYNNPECLAKLYEILIAFFKQDDIGILPPIHLSITLLNAGINHRNPQISNVCHRGLELLEKLSQPVCPSLNIQKTEEHNLNKVVINNTELEVELVEDVEGPETIYENNTSTLANGHEEEHSPNHFKSPERLTSNIEITENIEIHSPTKSFDLNFPSPTTKMQLTSNEITDAIVENIVTECVSEEPPTKKSKVSVDNDDLNDMFNSFQDVVQDCYLST